MRVRYRRIMLWSLVVVRLCSSTIGNEMGSRSSLRGTPTRRGNAVGRDFRSTGDKEPSAGEHDLIGGRATSVPLDGFIWQRKRKREEPAAVPTPDEWIKGNANTTGKFVRMHAFIVKDEMPPECGIAADKVTNTRYYMCSGTVLNENYVLTTATCMNRAEVYEYHIDGELSVLIGALDVKSYIIKIDYYKVHPSYTPDIDSIDYPIYNIAIARLTCSIPGESLVVPELPSNSFDDMGHLCCPNRCRVLTVIQTSKNRHRLKILSAKNVPQPTHDNLDSTFFNNSKQPASNKALLPHLLPLKRNRRISNGEPHMKNSDKSKAGEKSSNNMPFLRREVSAPSTEVNGDYILENNNHCPPLGTPVIVNNTLVALVAYTCQDAQSWVEWKYVSVTQNLPWIRKAIAKEHVQEL